MPNFTHIPCAGVHKFLCCFVAFVSYPLWIANIAQAQTPDVGGGIFSDSTGRQNRPCISPGQRADIEQRIQLSQQKLGIRPPQQKVPHPFLIHPLRKAAHCRDFYPSSVWQFVDHNPAIGVDIYNTKGPSNRDYYCGSRTYDNSGGYNHSGTDFGLWPFGWQKMDKNMVEVVAAAPGVILVKDDGNPDRSCNGAAQSANWNAVYIQHEDGSVAWYGHLKRGSLTFKPIGSTVEAGEYLGIVGSSGYSTAPHLHLEIRSSDNQLIDPYGGMCNAQNGFDSWWQYQEAYLTKQVNAVTFHRSLVNTDNNCPPENEESPNELETIRADNTGFYIYVWGRNIELNERVTTTLFRPDGSQYSSVTYSSTFESGTFYTYAVRSIPATEALGTWQARVTFGGQTYTRTFIVTGPGSDLSLSMQTSALAVPLNGTVEYGLTLKNEGTVTANNVLTQAYLPANLSFIDSPDGTMTHSGGIVSGNTASLGTGSQRTMRFRARPTTAGAYLTTAQVVQSSAQDVDSQANSGTRDGQDDMSAVLFKTIDSGSSLFTGYAPSEISSPPVIDNQPPIDPRRADLSLSVSTDNHVASVNDMVTVTLAIHHQGGTKAESITVRCVLPPEMTHVDGLSASGNEVTGEIPALYAGQQRMLTFRAMITQTGSLSIPAQITACNQLDPDSQPNNGTANGEDDEAQIAIRVR